MAGKILKYYPFRHLYRVTIELASPLKIGTGEHNLETDAPIAIDVNSMPYIPSTSLCGVVRHYLESFYPSLSKEIEQLFGNKEHGSRVIFSEGKIIGLDGYPIDGIDLNCSEVFSKFIEVPVRQHVRITEKGVAADKAKFDEEVLIKGARFCFEIETLSFNEEQQNSADELIKKVYQGFFWGNIYIGGGTRRGFGKTTITDIKHRKLDFSDIRKQDLDLYLKKSSNLKDSNVWADEEGHSVWQAFNQDNDSNESITTYTLELTPKDFFLFGSGKENAFGDIGMTQVKENIISWKGGKPQLKRKILIPASSIKGAISHRVTFRYNQRINNTVEHHMPNNEAVTYLFGANKEKLLRGNVLFEDIYLNDNGDNYTLSHNKIDRLTGGTIGTALFHESPSFVNSTINMRFLVDFASMRAQIERDYPNSKQENDTLLLNIRKSFEATLKDITHGILPLGGGTNRGNGIFNGSLYINGIKQ